MNNQSKFTTGPWTVVHSMEAQSEGCLIKSSKGWTLAEMRGPIRIEEEYANAALIAAAPDLLAELQRTLIAVREAYTKPGHYIDMETLIQDLETVIARAGGQS